MIRGRGLFRQEIQLSLKVLLSLSNLKTRRKHPNRFCDLLAKATEMRSLSEEAEEMEGFRGRMKSQSGVKRRILVSYTHHSDICISEITGWFSPPDPKGIGCIRDAQPVSDTE